MEEQFRLKTGLFGYTKESVSEYIANLKSEFKKNSSETEFRLFAVQEELVRLKSDQRGAAPAAIDLQSRQLAEENERLQTEVKDLRSELDRLRVKLAEAEKNVSALEAAASEKAAPSSVDTGESLSRILLETQQFADSLKARAVMEYNEQRAETEEKLKTEKARVIVYAAAIDDLRKDLEETLRLFSATLQQKRAEFDNIEPLDPSVEKSKPITPPADGAAVNMLRVSD